jgi:hypothetical protein
LENSANMRSEISLVRLVSLVMAAPRSVSLACSVRISGSSLGRAVSRLAFSEASLASLALACLISSSVMRILFSTDASVSFAWVWVSSRVRPLHRRIDVA